MVQTGKRLTSRQEQVALLARKFLQESDAHLVILVDDLEDRADEIQSVFETYRQPFDALLTPAGLESHASVHFMATMIEAYYFGDANAINEVLGTSLADCEDDPESIRNPKAKLKQHVKSLDPSRSFDEKADGFQIASKLDLPKVLSNPATCQSLRSLVKWCSRTIGDEDTERFQLTVGNICDVTGTQIPPANR